MEGLYEGFVCVFFSVLFFVLFFTAFTAQAQSVRRSAVTGVVQNDQLYDNRFSFYLGGFFPSGKYEEPGYPALNYETGFAEGFNYTRFLNNYFGLGFFIDSNYFTSEEKEI